jgi:AmmeMemoRadiSam system protein A
MTADDIAAAHGKMMLEFVGKTIAHGLSKGAPPAVDTKSFPADLTAPGATFVTVEKDGKLRGCIGSLQAHRPLIEDLVHNAYRAAFKDPRFPPLTKAEAPSVTWSISLLSAPERMLVGDEKDLLSQLVPGVDGLIIADGGKRATFLPQVWDQLPDPNTFLAHLKRKAGMAPDHWSKTFEAHRYRAIKIG